MPDLSFEQFGHRLDAEARLALLDALEPDAQWYDAEASPELRRGYAASYRKAVGVAPEERAALRSALERLQETGATSVDALIAGLRAQSGNALSAAGAAGA